MASPGSLPFGQHSKARRTSIHDWLTQRSLGQERRAGGRQRHLHRQLCSVLTCVRSWNPRDTINHAQYGGIFNFDFSTDGSLLVAACEKTGILMFDPLNSKLIGSKDKAHQDSVNCVKFLDTRLFATCSDDTTVRLWDVRSLKNDIMTLNGHSHWVKNIEYSHDLLVTSGFDGNVCTWDINRHSASSTTEVMCQRVFHTNGLMRSKLSPDGSKLIITTTSGFLILIHNLDLEMLPHDTRGFRPNNYNLMRRLGENVTAHEAFWRRRNRIELITDFPSRNDAGMIASMDVHPHGWCAISRNSSSQQDSEWTCVHDIQQKDECLSEGSADSLLSAPPIAANPPESARRELLSSPRLLHSFSVNSNDHNVVTTSDALQTDSDSTSVNQDGHRIRRLALPSYEINSSEWLSGDSHGRFELALNTDSEEEEERNEEVSRAEELWFDSFFGNADDDDIDDDDDDSGSNHGDDDNDVTLNTGEADEATEVFGFDSRQDILGNIVNEPLSIMVAAPPRRPSVSPTFTRFSHEFTDVRSQSFSAVPTRPRLTHYIEEPNVGRGFIKEIGFGMDGRVICSPFGYGVRLLAFDSDCRELCDCIPDKPTQLHEVAANISHAAVVVCAKFSPVHTLLVTGCLNGKVDFHQPVW